MIKYSCTKLQIGLSKTKQKKTRDILQVTVTEDRPLEGACFLLSRADFTGGCVCCGRCTAYMSYLCAGELQKMAEGVDHFRS